jgi:hypothetical protein
MDTLKTMLVITRTKLRDLSVRSFLEPELIIALNEGKNELAKIIRQANENFFEDTTTGTISATTSPNYSSITLPTDFSVLRDLHITNIGYEDIRFVKEDQSSNKFRGALVDGGNFGAGSGTFLYDFKGKDTIILAPGANVELTYSLDYIKTVPDMTLPDHYPIGIPAEHWDFIVTWAITECMRSVNDKRLSNYEGKLEYQAKSVIQSVNSRQAREPQYVKGFLEDEVY